MKVKLDENLPVSLADVLTQLDHDVDTVHDEGLTGENDQTIWQAAQIEHRFLITQDLDFSDARKYASAEHAGVLVERIREPSRLKLTHRVSVLFENEDVATWQGCFIISTDTKLRIRRPAKS